MLDCLPLAFNDDALGTFVISLAFSCAVAAQVGGEASLELSLNPVEHCGGCTVQKRERTIHCF